MEYLWSNEGGCGLYDKTLGITLGGDDLCPCPSLGPDSVGWKTLSPSLLWSFIKYLWSSEGGCGVCNMTLGITFGGDVLCPCPSLGPNSVGWKTLSPSLLSSFILSTYDQVKEFAIWL